MTAAKECIICSTPFPVRFPSSRKKTCSRRCAGQAIARGAAKRTGEANGRWDQGRMEHPLYWVYSDMLGRCYRPTHQRFADYGGRGIRVDARWREDFWAFVTDMGPRPGGKRNGRHIYSLDRIDNDGDYGPANCRWATYAEQAANKRDRSAA